MNTVEGIPLAAFSLLFLVGGVSGCDDFCIGECTGPTSVDGGDTSNSEDDGAGEGADGTGGGAVPSLCNYPAFSALSNCESVPYLALPLRGTDTVPPNSNHTVEHIEGFWERSTYDTDEWAKLHGHLDFRGGLSIPTQGRTHFSIMAATDDCSEGWWSSTIDLGTSQEIPVVGSEVLTIDGKEVVKVDHVVPDPNALTTAVEIIWYVELCEPYIFIVDAMGGVMSPATFSNPGGVIVENDPGGTFEVIIGMGAVTYGSTA